MGTLNNILDIIKLWRKKNTRTWEKPYTGELPVQKSPQKLYSLYFGLFSKFPSSIGLKLKIKHVYDNN